MGAKRLICYKDGDVWIGWLDELPDCRTQGATLRELKDIHDELTSGSIPRVRRVGKLILA